MIDANPIWFTRGSSACLCIHVLDYDDLKDDENQSAAITLLNPMFDGERSTLLIFMEIISEDVEELNCKSTVIIYDGMLIAVAGIWTTRAALYILMRGELR